VEILILSLFCAALLVCLLLDVSILYALLLGLFLFLFYGQRRGFALSELGKMALEGVMKVKNILITFVLIGVLTALWRDAGVISVIVCYAARLIHPPLFILMAFLLNCLISFLTGTAFGTAATMGVICMTIASALGVSPLPVGGAVLAGSFFGDRCSPVSTSALLVSELTKTSIFDNIRRMLRSCLVPLLISCGLYALWGFISTPSGDLPDLNALFSREFTLSWICLLPAAVLLILSLLKVNVKLAMALCILATLPVSLFIQHTPALHLPMVMFRGFQAADPEVSSMLSGGGILSMLKVSAIVCLSSSYSGIFEKTGLLNAAQRGIDALTQRSTSFVSVLLTSILSGVVACNQTLTIMITHQLCRQTEPDSQRLALYLEDTAVVISPLIPWSIACAVPLTTIGVSSSCVLTAFFLYLLPLWQLICSFLEKHRKSE